MDIYRHQELKRLRKLRKRKRRAGKRQRQQQEGMKPEKALAKDFFRREEWKRLRYDILKRDGGRCQLCGRGAQDGVILCVDHIKPRHKYPHLAMEPSNLQTLCGACNAGKGARDKTDWRPKPGERAAMEANLDLEAIADLRERGLLN